MSLLDDILSGISSTLGDRYLGSESPADQALNIAGSVMGSAKTGERETAANQGPLMGTIMDMAKTAFDPFGVGKPGEAILGPIRSQAQKNVVKAMWRHDPEAVKAMLTDPRVVNIEAFDPSLRTAQEIVGQGGAYEGSNALGRFNPSMSRIQIPPWTQQGRSINLANETGPTFSHMGRNLPEVAGHELQHFLNLPRLYGEGGLPEENAQAAYNVLSRYINDPAQGAAKAAMADPNDWHSAVNEALSYLSGRGTRNPLLEREGSTIHDILKVKPGLEQGTTRGVQVGPATLLRAESVAKDLADKQRIAERAQTFEGKSPRGWGSAGFWKSEDIPPKFSRGQLSPLEQQMLDKASRAGRTFQNTTDIQRAAAGEQLPPLGSAFPDIPRPTSSPGGLANFEELSRKLGLTPPAGGVPPLPPESPLSRQAFAEQLRQLQSIIPGFQPKISQTLLGR